mgnify:CR=1 FL=1|jgi:hypothetical protein
MPHLEKITSFIFLLKFHAFDPYLDSAEGVFHGMVAAAFNLIQLRYRNAVTHQVEVLL